MALLLRALDTPVPGGRAELLASSTLVAFWTTFSGPSLLMSLAAGLVGCLLISANRSELTIGAMIALALIPSLSLVPLALLVGELQVAKDGLLRWATDVGIVLASSLLVFG